MNIKSDEAYALAAELAAKSGTSLTQVVLEALRAQAKALSKEERLRKALAICESMRSRMSPEALAFDIDTELYDEDGLPK